MITGFNYAYRRTATVAPTPSSTTSALPAHGNTHTSQPPTKTTTPAPERPLPPHLANKSAASTPPPAVPEHSSGKESPRINGTMTSEKAEKEKAKKKEKKERKDKEKAEKVDREKEVSTPDATQESSTPIPVPDDPWLIAMPELAKEISEETLKSPTDSSTGVRTPKTGKPPRNPWTIFMKMQAQLSVSEAEIRDFFGDAKGGVST